MEVDATVVTLPDTSESEGVPRPGSLREFIGQSHAKKNLEIFFAAAHRRSEPLDHIIFSGPPGLGKTTLARIVAGEMGGGFKMLSAPSIQKPTDIVSTLVTAERGDIIFIDEIHRLPVPVEETLYTAMEDFRIDLIVGEGAEAKSVSVPLERFTLVGATTRKGALSVPLLDRFGISVDLLHYTENEMILVLERASDKIGMSCGAGALSVIASRSRGTPRIGLRLLKRVHDFVLAHDSEELTAEAAALHLDSLGIDANGLDENDRRYVECLRGRFRGGPVGLKTLAAALGLNADTIEYSMEPYLIVKGIVDRTPRGRILIQSRREGQGLILS
ncbi:Holliday junction branch migration DNA helicase RuvB [Roseibium sp. RKSG952]|uniref:Holliday junction branch migration DNA helicase RuvB n=1 Tax=Roseibium sp. RKSG952 TaxID=2529384 RepID=UPI0012BCD12B|nr:Holliday junction branch migration DNA helicase RuvB [Roseibium sp. RKSG952]MTH97577.1 Holliday junction branch migration DNA helicase RuvB [Roseibium sp. RKSG952]